ncbi:ABC transporter permease [Adhaeribacter sp. BT258]|uniref:ABC transporter permease n=1 Tax=Adhaeribacter terrigena TaxID=2793070 RepID=A0ABS1BYQ1_9BACT|nr:ABC transporter permease [Adhaeribacter terrigena]MBK0402271.1 ABC transporter permease [Adhaeribacter terrigena]
MLTLLRTEYRKILPYRTFWVILGIFTGLLFLIVRSAASITINGQTAGPTLYNFPDIWQRLTYIASYFNLLLGILVIILITDEYGFRTLRQQIIDGYFRTDVIASKLLVLLSIAFFATLVVASLGLGFGLSATENASAQQITGNMMYLVYYFVQTLGYMVLAMFVAFLVKKNGLAIIAFLLYFFVEWIIRFKIDDSINQYFPGKVLNSLAPNPTQSIIDSAVGITTTALPPQQAIFPAVFYIVLLTVFAYLLLKSRDL